MTREEILDFLRQHKQEMSVRFGVTKIGHFGSYARGDARDDSDVDVAIELSKNTADSYFGLLIFWRILLMRILTLVLSPILNQSLNLTL